MKLYQIPAGLSRGEYAKATLIGLAMMGSLQGKDPANRVAVGACQDASEITDPLPEEFLSAIESGSIRCDRSWDSPPDDTLVSLAAYAQGKEPPPC